MKKKILFTHDDLDGAGCAIVFKLACNAYYNPSYEVRHCGNSNIDEIITKTPINSQDVIYFADICPSKETLLKLLEDGLTVNIFDHHKTNLYVNELVEPYPAATANVVVDVDGKMESGTSLLFKHFESHLEDAYGQQFQVLNHRMVLISALVDTIRSYDTYEWKESNNIEAKQLQTLFGLLGTTRFVERCVNQVMELTHTELITPEEMMFVDSKLEREQKSIDSIKSENITVFDVHGYKTAFQFYNGINFSELAHQYLTKHPNLDMFISIDLDSKTVQVRTIRDDIDTGKLISAPCNGGGHPKASGFILPNAIKQAALQSVLLYIEEKTDPHISAEWNLELVNIHRS